MMFFSFSNHFYEDAFRMRKEKVELRPSLEVGEKKNNTNTKERAKQHVDCLSGEKMVAAMSPPAGSEPLSPFTPFSFCLDKTPP